MEMMAVWAAVLITYGVFPGIAMQPVANDIIQLDMAPNSVDDMYDGCRDKMSNVVNEYLENEKNTNNNFKEAWDEAAKFYDNHRKGFMRMEREQFVAVYAYTSAKGNIHDGFNAAIRGQGSEYKTTFGYHALHFYLTLGLQFLKAKERSLGKKCLTSYRRVNRYFSQDVKNTEIRFGSFASSSLGHYSKAEVFGDKSCFEIFTCFGADVSLLSMYEDIEGEVLIPPYEVFKVTEIKKRSENKQLPCEVVYKLKSTRPLSDLNCVLFPK